MENNVYATPESDVDAKLASASRIRLYSPTQIACGTLGGPVGLIYFLMANFETLQKPELRKKTLHLGIALIVALIVILPFLPESFPSMPFTVAYIVIGYFVAESFQMKKKEIIESEVYDFYSNWRVLGFGLLCMLGSIVVIAGPLMLLELLGVW